MKRAVLLAATCCGLAGGALAQGNGLCERVQGFVAQADLIEAQAEQVTLQLPSLFATEPDCGTSMFMSGARSVHCAWAFDYRTEAATQTFEALAHGLAACPGVRVPKKTGGLVNHPDSYDQRTVRFDVGSVSISLKDKGNLQQTYIFVRTLGRGQ